MIPLAATIGRNAKNRRHLLRIPYALAGVALLIIAGAALACGGAEYSAPASSASAPYIPPAAPASLPPEAGGTDNPNDSAYSLTYYEGYGESVH